MICCQRADAFFFFFTGSERGSWQKTLALVINGSKRNKSVVVLSDHSCLPKTLSHSVRWIPGSPWADPPVVLLMCPQWPLSASRWPNFYTQTHTPTHTISTDSNANQEAQSSIPASSKSRMSFPPGIKSQSKSGASERGGGEEERTAEAAPHLAASCSALCQIETEASCTLCRWTHIYLVLWAGAITVTLLPAVGSLERQAVVTEVVMLNGLSDHVLVAGVYARVCVCKYSLPNTANLNQVCTCIY